uniref:RNA helicase n=1 Tax=Hirondellea gigas TaxID=1518452 RepID=A0A6A7FVX0_9CRUS
MPSVIQQIGIPAMLSGMDLIAQAQSGTGKTGTFCVGTLNNVDVLLNECQVLVLAPTRELAEQIYDVMIAFSVHIRGIKVHVCLGGNSFERDVTTLQNGVHIVVGTPGRVNHMIRKGFLSLRQLRTFVLDEADEMLSRGFTEQIFETFQSIGQKVQVCLFSATLDVPTINMSQKFLNDPVRIILKKAEVTLEGISQFYVELKRRSWKFDTLCDLYETLTINQSIIYCNKKSTVEHLTGLLRGADHVVSATHGEMRPETRKAVMAEFRKGESRVLVTTDLMGRGIDVQGVSLVVNYDLPYEKEKYIHRIGRSGRFGKKGVAINFVVTDDDYHRGDAEKLREIEEYYSTEIKEMPGNVVDYM